jgi:hypothetical protein
MVKMRIETKFKAQFDPSANRTCGSCYACCIWLGIEELKKYTGQPCQHLTGDNGPNHRCSIYKDRPPACSGYKCFWLSGWGPKGLKPDKSGILVTAYPSEKYPDKFSITMTVFDSKKAEPHIKDMLGSIVGLPLIDDARLLYIKEKRAILFREGNIYACDILPPDGYEALIFAAHEPPIGTYYSQEINE